MSKHEIEQVSRLFMGGVLICLDKGLGLYLESNNEPLKGFTQENEKNQICTSVT